MIKNRIILFCVIILFMATSAMGEGPVSKSTAEDQTAVEITVYNSNLGLVKETRRIDIPSGQGELRFMDVASRINPVTVHVKSVNSPKLFTVVEQNYEYDLMNEKKLLDKYVGKKIKIIDWNEYQDRKYTVKAELLSNNEGQIYRIGGEIYLGHPGVKVFPELPENLIAKPTLTWLYKNGSKVPHNLEVSYLTDGISWKADYVLVLDKDDTSTDISGWVTVDNKSGATYGDATLQLVAGKVHRAERQSPDRAALMKGMVMEDAAEPQFKEKAFYEYHIYDLQRKTTIKDRQTKQISLFEAAGVGIKKEFLVQGTRAYFTNRVGGDKTKTPVNVYVKFKNSKDNSLGMPLPEGIMRIYKKDERGSQQFVGEDRIEHTPRNEEVKLKTGEAFDIVAERRQKDFKKLSTKLYESEWEITLKNRKKNDIVVGVIEPLFGNWQLIENSHQYTKVDAFTIRFDVTVPKDKEVTVTYRVRVGT
ncbi:MAG: DUF4139 domain-containing protein [Deltaproteobacteria bacterium]|nr:DUF4139 domain-containing protein [Deltaproteobacteria bacterium]